VESQEYQNQEPAASSSYARALSLLSGLKQPAMRAAIRELGLPAGSRGLDAACGIGRETLLLAEAVGPAGHVTGLDFSPEFLVHARRAAARAGLSERISFREGDLNHLPFGDFAFDWVWSVDAIWPGPRELGCPAEEPLPLVKELARVVKPGGIVAILFWSSHKLLPGYPLLEARLNTTSLVNAPFTKGTRPERHCLRALGWLRAADLKEPTARTFVVGVQSPLAAGSRSAMTTVFQMLWGEAQSEVTAEDWADFERLCQPESPDFLLNLPDYYAFFTYSLFFARVAA
jgi:ubiquinone/menaquinone biosynthesis C-methylase UbiE